MNTLFTDGVGRVKGVSLEARSGSVGCWRWRHGRKISCCLQMIRLCWQAPDNPEAGDRALSQGRREG